MPKDTPVNLESCLIPAPMERADLSTPFRLFFLICRAISFLLCYFVQAKVITYFNTYKFYSLKMISRTDPVITATPWLLQRRTASAFDFVESTPWPFYHAIIQKSVTQICIIKEFLLSLHPEYNNNGNTFIFCLSWKMIISYYVCNWKSYHWALNMR